MVLDDDELKVRSEGTSPANRVTHLQQFHNSSLIPKTIQ